MNKEYTVDNFNWKGEPIKYLRYMKHKDKLELANKLVMYRYVIDGEEKIMYELPDHEMNAMLEMIGAYTDIKIPDEEDARIDLYDELCEMYLEMGTFVLKPVEQDVSAVLRIADIMANNVRNTHEAQNSFSHQIGKLVGNLNNEELSEMLAQNEDFLGLVRDAVNKPEKKMGKVLQFPSGVMKKHIEE